MTKTAPSHSPTVNPPKGEAPAEPTRSAVNAVFQGVSSEELLGERGELKIQHNGELYSLRRTRQGKLILTK